MKFRALAGIGIVLISSCSDWVTVQTDQVLWQEFQKQNSLRFTDAQIDRYLSCSGMPDPSQCFSVASQENADLYRRIHQEQHRFYRLIFSGIEFQTESWAKQMIQMCVGSKFQLGHGVDYSSLPKTKSFISKGFSQCFLKRKSEMLPIWLRHVTDRVGVTLIQDARKEWAIREFIQPHFEQELVHQVDQMARESKQRFLSRKPANQAVRLTDLDRQKFERDFPFVNPDQE